jgi:hypothetical protein
VTLLGTPPAFRRKGQVCKLGGRTFGVQPLRGSVRTAVVAEVARKRIRVSPVLGSGRVRRYCCRACGAKPWIIPADPLSGL